MPALQKSSIFLGRALLLHKLLEPRNNTSNQHELLGDFLGCQLGPFSAFPVGDTWFPSFVSIHFPFSLPLWICGFGGLPFSIVLVRFLEQRFLFSLKLPPAEYLLPLLHQNSSCPVISDLKLPRPLDQYSVLIDIAELLPETLKYFLVCSGIEKYKRISAKLPNEA